ncbi:MAG: hypothetical protein WCH34_07360 [Bacteroidota bacterium]
MKGAKAYVCLYYVGDNPPLKETDWIFGNGTTKRSAELSGFSKKATVWVKVCGITIGGLTKWLEPIHITIV